jgi:glycosyltransferase involved in cell wall biosynthesis
VGRLCEQKGQLLLIEAAATLCRQGVEFELVLVGDGEFRGAIEAAITRHAIEDRVRLVGWATNAAVVELLQASRGLVLASFAEGLPVVIMESLALSRPVVSTWVAGIPELIRDGESGWLVPPGNAELLAQGMAKMLSATPAELDRMGKCGRTRVARFHDALQEGTRLEMLIQQAVATAATR